MRLHIKNITILKISLTAVFGFLFMTSFTFASTKVYFDTQNLSPLRGEVFSVDFKVSADRSINVIDGTILFDKSKLSVKEIHIDDSLFTLWVKEPVFDNTKGEIALIGGVPGGFIGQNGQIMEIVFVAKRAGKAKINFQDIFSLYVHDGLGTRASFWMSPLTLSITQIVPDTFIGKTLQILSDTDEDNNHIPSILIVVLIISIAIILVKTKKKKKSMSR